MVYMNYLEAKLNRLRRELRVAELNNWEFDIQCLKDEILELEIEIENEYENGNEVETF